MRAHRTRPWWERAAGLWLAAWFLVAALDLPALHTCTMHGATHGTAHAAAPASAMANMAAMATMTAPAPSAHRASPGDAAADHGSAPAHAAHACTCLGDCAAAIGVLPPAPPAVVAAGALVPARVPAPGRPSYEYVAAWADFVLPFSTAPPGLAPA